MHGVESSKFTGGPGAASAASLASAAYAGEGPEVTFVLPCLDEVKTLPACLRAIDRCVRAHDLRAEVVVADNGSTDGSREAAAALGARVVEVKTRGYGSALAAGFGAARGTYVVMGDADDSYDFEESIRLIEKLRDGCDLVMGARFPARGGRIDKGAMPWKHRYIGNPALTGIGRLLFRSPVADFHCGLRGLTKAATACLGLRTTGMEFASEMVVKATLRGMRIGEVPVTLRRDGRGRPPHLRSWRDGWRHLTFMLCLSPRWTLVLPGAFLLFAGVLLMAMVGAGPLSIRGVRLDVHTLVASSLMVLIGYQVLLGAAAVRLHVLDREIGPPGAGVRAAFAWLTPGWGLLVAGGFAIMGGVLLVIPVRAWLAADLGDLEPTRTLRPMIIGATLVALGGQTAFMAFIAAMLRVARR